MKKLLLICAIALCFVGCESSPQQIHQSRAASLASDGEVMGRLKDGREVRRYIIDNGEFIPDHYIYTVGDSETRTANFRVGKHGLGVQVTTEE